MREKLNSDPKTQVIAVVVLVVLAAFFFIAKSGGGEEAEEEAVVPTEAPIAVVGEEGVENASAAAVAVPSSIQGPPLPKPVTAAYKADKTVVLLIVQDGGIDDKMVKSSVEGLSSLKDVAVFVVPASQIYRYASITLGVEVSRVPALVVVRPRNLSHGTREASVSYGFLDTQSVRQAVEDASYKGPEVSYHPN